MKTCIYIYIFFLQIPMQNMINPITQGLNGGMHGAKSLIITGLLRNSIK